MGQRQRFTPKFKRQAVQLLTSGQPPAAAPRNRLYTWQKEVAVHAWQGVSWIGTPSRTRHQTGPHQAGIRSSY